MNVFKSLFKADKEYLGVTGITKELNALYIYNKLIESNKNILVVTNSLYEANNLYQRLLNYTKDVLFFPMDDFLTSEALAISPELKTERINTLNTLTESNSNKIVICNLMGLLRFLPDKKTWKKATININISDTINREELISNLLNNGYQRESLVTEMGKFAIRGYVIDVFPVGENNPIRIELWGDEVEDIKEFNIDTQLTFNNRKNIIIKPFNESLNNNKKNIIDYLDNDYICFMLDYNQIINGYKILCNTIVDYKQENNIEKEFMYQLEDLKLKNIIYLMNIDNTLEDISLKDIEKYESHDIENYKGDFNLLLKDIKKYIKENNTVIFCIESKVLAKKILNLFDKENIVITDENNIKENKINIIKKSITSGFIYNKLIVISENDLFNQKERKTKYKNKYKMSNKISSINNIEKGDYVVHENFGIGIYDELTTLTKNGIKKDYLKIIYANNDFLYIPVENIDKISKFSGKDSIQLKLSKLGTDHWNNKKASVRKKLEDIARSLLEVSAARRLKEGFSFSKDNELQTLFENEFIYELTDDQKKSINNIKKEMEAPQPMDMLLCGDVGYGKTEVAFRSAFKAINDGKQVAYLCPTTILSSQQYNNAINRFAKFPVNIALINRFVDRKKQKQILKDLKEGKIDLVFGTHRLLSEDIEYKDLGLLIVDEEQRFGVTHKEKIKKYKSNIDVLTLSATPIPRTLQMSISGVRSLSLIETPPAERYPIQTYVLAENNAVIKDAIYKELSREGQIFILYNSVEKIEQKMNEIKRLVPEAKIDFAHGQMSKIELENKMQDFINHEFDVLICTTIIETGIDIPNVNSLIIIDADKFGLSQLYQIRGRIGRSNKIGYAYLMYDKNKILNEIAIKRLDTIKEFTELGSGFKIAIRDLSIRGAGDILGKNQSGFIDTIGIDLYLKMLEQEVKKIKGEEIEEETETITKPLLEVSTHISDDYVDDDNLKIEIHKKINEIVSLKSLKSIKNEIEDRFGKMDKDMQIYLYEELFEKLAKDLEITKVQQTKSYIDITIPSRYNEVINGNKLFEMVYEISKNFKLKFVNNEIHIILNTNKLKHHYLNYLLELLIKLKKDITQ